MKAKSCVELTLEPQPAQTESIMQAAAAARKALTQCQISEKREKRMWKWIFVQCKVWRGKDG